MKKVKQITSGMQGCSHNDDEAEIETYCPSSVYIYILIRIIFISSFILNNYLQDLKLLYILKIVTSNHSFLFCSFFQVYNFTVLSFSNVC